MAAGPQVEVIEDHFQADLHSLAGGAPEPDIDDADLETRGFWWGPSGRACQSGVQGGGSDGVWL